MLLKPPPPPPPPAALPFLSFLLVPNASPNFLAGLKRELAKERDQLANASLFRLNRCAHGQTEPNHRVTDRPTDRPIVPTSVLQYKPCPH